MNMKNKEKYDLRKLIFLWEYNLHYDICGASIVYENEYIAGISLGGNNPMFTIMNWLEMECEEND